MVVYSIARIKVALGEESILTLITAVDFITAWAAEEVSTAGGFINQAFSYGNKGEEII